MEQQEALLIPDRLVDESAVDNAPVMDHKNPNRGSRSALVHLAVLTTVLLPITLLPYCVASRNIALLRRRLNEYVVATARLQRDLRTTALENALIRDEHSRVRELLSEIRQESRNIDVEMKQDLEKLRVEGEHQTATQAASNKSFRSDLQKALDETRRTRTAQFAVQKEIGISLAEVAAFMHEQSLSEGKESHRTDRLRWLALSLQNPMQDLQEKNPSGSESSTDAKSELHR